ncbi:MAG: RdgB/HAM1 family non-canonical purine NTP pyrophosphatase [Chloroflexi bacterium]|nr:RdgB/HAM1 family non-canonical purine NTP pyrophosphatase [Chloroflexota bacterium]
MRGRPRQILLASSNPGKLKDLKACLGAGLEILTPADVGLSAEVHETGATYVENARLKAEAYFDAIRVPTLGEDSGLEIAALNGGPGVFSARFQGLPDGPIKNAHILQLLAGVPPSRRGCRYHCVMVLVEADGSQRAFEGTCAGRIAPEPTGHGGFGFDPIVFIPRLGRTLAELSDEERLAINHRGRAARKLARYLTSRERALIPSPLAGEGYRSD